MQARTGCSILTAAGLQVSPARPDASQMAPASCCRRNFSRFPWEGSLSTRMSGPFFFLLVSFYRLFQHKPLLEMTLDDSQVLTGSSSRLHFPLLLLQFLVIRYSSSFHFSSAESSSSS
jgi:hypothetical protein